MIGLYGHHDNLVRGLGAVCQTRSGEVSRTALSGKSEGRVFELICEDQKTLVGLATRAGSLIDAAGVICAAE